MAGSVAFKLRHKYPQLGNATNTLQGKLAAQVSQWIQINSNGSLLQPSSEFLKVAQAVEEVFLKIQGHDAFNKSSNIVENIMKEVNQICPQADSVPEEAVRRLIKTRIYFRVREFNRKKVNKIISFRIIFHFFKFIFLLVKFLLIIYL